MKSMAPCHLLLKSCTLAWIFMLMQFSSIKAEEEPTNTPLPTDEPQVPEFESSLKRYVSTSNFISQANSEEIKTTDILLSASTSNHYRQSILQESISSTRQNTLTLTSAYISAIKQESTGSIMISSTSSNSESSGFSINSTSNVYLKPSSVSSNLAILPSSMYMSFQINSVVTPSLSSSNKASLHHISSLSSVKTDPIATLPSFDSISKTAISIIATRTLSSPISNIISNSLISSEMLSSSSLNKNVSFLTTATSSDLTVAPKSSSAIITDKSYSTLYSSSLTVSAPQSSTNIPSQSEISTSSEQISVSMMITPSSSMDFQTSFMTSAAFQTQHVSSLSPELSLSMVTVSYTPKVSMTTSLETPVSMKTSSIEVTSIQQPVTSLLSSNIYSTELLQPSLTLSSSVQLVSIATTMVTSLLSPQVSTASSFGLMSSSIVPTTPPAKAPSSPPLNVQVYNKTSTSIFLSWQPPPEQSLNGRLLWYEVNVQKISKDMLCKADSLSTSHVKATSTVVQGHLESTLLSLKPTSSFRRESLTPSGESIPSSLTTNLPPPPMSLTSYNIIHRAKGPFILLDKLDVYTCYGVRVRAVTSLPGPWSSFLLARTNRAGPAAPPLDVRAFAKTSSSILVKWLSPPPEYTHGIIKFYVVEYFKVSDRKHIKNNTTINTNLTLHGLLPFTEYRIRVKAVNSFGSGPFSEEVYNTTFEDAPSPARNLTIWSINSTSLSVVWSEPMSLNGAAIKYKLYYRLTTYNDSKNVLAYDGPDTESIITGLQSSKNYTLTLLAYNVRLGAQSSQVFGFAYTIPTVTTKPADARAWNLSSSSVFVTWKPPQKISGTLQHYEVFYKPNCSSSIPGKVNAGLATNASLISMRAYTLYVIYVYAVTSQGLGQRATVFVMTDEGAPSAVTSFNYQHKKSTSVVLKWTPPALPNGHIGYQLEYGQSENFTSSKILFMTKTNITLLMLQPYSTYTFIINAYNLKKRLHGPSRNITTKTLADSPSAPRNVRLVDSTATTLNITWDKPETLNGFIVSYTIKIYEPENNQLIDSTRVFKRWITIENLKPDKKYKMNVACTTNGGPGPYSEKVVFQTLPSVPPTMPPLKPPNRDAITENQIVIELKKASDSNGKISFYQVIVLELKQTSDGKPVLPDKQPDDFTASDLVTYAEARQQQTKLLPYIAAQFPSNDLSKYQEFSVGDGRNFTIFARKRRSASELYYNGPLKPKTFYTMFQRAAVNKDVYRSTKWTEPVSTSESPNKQQKVKRESSTNVGLVVGLCFAVACLVIIVIVVVSFAWKKRRFPFGIMLDDEGDYTNHSFKLKNIHSGKRRRTSSRGLMGSTDSLDNLDDINRRLQPIPLEDFTKHVRQMHIDGDIGFSEEYELVQPDDKDFTWQYSLHPVNKHKNRYANIVAYDHSRVLLKPVDGVQGSDYINANYIDGYSRSGAYIATQGPLHETFDDFWRMIWEQGTATIVMLTQLEERGRRKCDKYWPDRGTQTYGVIRVTASESSHMSYYNLRVFIISHKNEEDEPRQVKQYHFTSWPDHGVPTHPVPLLSLVRTVASANPATAGPAVVHCSAGVGRTGTYITLDSVLQRIEKEQTIDVYEFVKNMRTKRNLMVQTESQYVFIHDALVEAVSCGITECEAKKFATKLRELREVEPKSGRTYMEIEFLRLVKDERHHSTFKAANMGVNSSKNRYLNILPFEQSRVPLKMRPGEVGSDYINASYIDGYCRRKVFIATQAPLPCTFEDYWRMIWEQGSCVIVMLTKEEEAGKVKCHRYWPSDGTRIFGDILVELVEEVSYTDYTMRQFKMTHTEDKGSRVVRQYHYTDWPDVGLPESGVGIIDLIGQVEKWQQQSNNSIITVHCSGGVGRTGVYCAISILIERVKSEGVIDVFQTVQSLRLQRPAMVQILMADAPAITLVMLMCHVIKYSKSICHVILLLNGEKREPGIEAVRVQKESIEWMDDI